MAEKNITAHKGTAPSGREEMPAPENYLRPAVDIFETEENLTLAADLPGVKKEHLDISLEKGILTIKGTIEPTSRGQALFREFCLANFYRQFQLPNGIDTEKTAAKFEKGVLTLTIPKSAAAKPKRIEIRH
jgi:HSP20 family molecular chaperone IbpA